MLELEMVSVTTLLPTLLPTLTINVYLFHYDDIVIYCFFCVFTASAMLLVSLVPSNSFKQTFRMSRSMLSPHKDIGVCIHYVFYTTTTYGVIYISANVFHGS